MTYLKVPFYFAPVFFWKLCKSLKNSVFIPLFSPANFFFYRTFHWFSKGETVSEGGVNIWLRGKLSLPFVTPLTGLELCLLKCGTSERCERWSYVTSGELTTNTQRQIESSWIRDLWGSRVVNNKQEEKPHCRSYTPVKMHPAVKVGTSFFNHAFFTRVRPPQCAHTLLPSPPHRGSHMQGLTPCYISRDVRRWSCS